MPQILANPNSKSPTVKIWTQKREILLNLIKSQCKTIEIKIFTLFLYPEVFNIIESELSCLFMPFSNCSLSTAAADTSKMLVLITKYGWFT